MFETYKPRKVIPDILSVLAKHNLPPISIDDIAKDLKEMILWNPALYTKAVEEVEPVANEKDGNAGGDSE